MPRATRSPIGSDWSGDSRQATALERTTRTVSVRRAMRTHLCGELAGRPTSASACGCAAGWPSAASTASTWPSSTSATTPGVVQCVVDGSVDVRSEYVRAGRGDRAAASRGDEQPRARDRRGRDRRLRGRGPRPGRAAAVRRRRPGRGRRGGPARATATSTCAGRACRPTCGCGPRCIAAMRAAMERQGFCEVETPLLWAPTPEGAREFAVPSGCTRGSFYVLPQSPQLAKQLLMVAGFDRYYQIARCLRDEDLRADRQFEFTQLDLEASFVGQDDVLVVVTEAVLDAAEAVTGERARPRSQRMTWAEAMDRFGTDKPDLRFGMELVDLADVFAGTEVQALRGAVREGDRGRRAVRALGRDRLDALVERAEAARGEGPGLVPGDARRARGADARLAARPVPLRRRARRAASRRPARAAGDLRARGGRRAGARPARCSASCASSSGGRPVGEGPHRYLWVIDFPLFDGVDDDGRPDRRPPPLHHAAPRRPRPARDRPAGGALARPTTWCSTGGSSARAASGSTAPTSSAGSSTSSGSPDEEAEARFGFLLGAFRYGAPPHGGLRRRASTGWSRSSPARRTSARSSPSRRPSPGADPMTGAPKPLAARRVRELGLRLGAGTGLTGTGRAGARQDAHGRGTATGRHRPLRGGGGERLGDRGPARRTPAAAHARRDRRPAPPGRAGRAAAGADRVGPADLGHPVGAARAPARRPSPRWSPAPRAKEFVPLSAVSAGVKDVREVVDDARRAPRRAADRARSSSSTRSTGSTRPSRTCCCPRSKRAWSSSSGPPPRTRSSRSTRRCSAARRCGGSSPLDDDDVAEVVRRGLDAEGATADAEAVAALVSVADGDARAALGTLEVAVGAGRRTPR